MSDQIYDPERSFSSVEAYIAARRQATFATKVELIQMETRVAIASAEAKRELKLELSELELKLLLKERDRLRWWLVVTCFAAPAVAWAFLNLLS